MVDFRVKESSDDGSKKVVAVVVEIQGPEGPTEEEHIFEWAGSERYTPVHGGKLRSKTGGEYKAEIQECLNEEYSPKG